jgi:PAS domain S-box-containing protein
VTSNESTNDGPVEPVSGQSPLARAAEAAVSHPSGSQSAPGTGAARSAGDAELTLDQVEATLRQMASLGAPAGFSFRSEPNLSPGIDATEGAGRDLARLREAELRYRALVEKIPAVTFLASLDGDRHEFYVSPQIEALLGFSQKEWLDDPFLWYYRVHPEDRQRWGVEFASTCSTGVQFCSEYRMLARDGRVVWVHGECQVVRDEHGHPTLLQGIAFDITDRKRAMEVLERSQIELEAQVRQRTAELSRANEALRAEMAERKRAEEQMRQAKDAAEAASRAKDQFLAKLSHELRTPLMPVLGTVQMLQSDPGLSAQAQDDIGMIRRNVELEARLIDDLLDLTRISQGKVHLRCQAVDAHATVRHALEVCRPGIDEKKLEVSLGLRAGEHVVWADPIRFQQILWNLVSNAVKFTPANGRITIRTLNDSQGKLTVQVVDSGIGMEPDVLPRLFNAFEQGEQTITRRFGGLGLGLTIAKALAEMHHGSIAAESAGKDKGATFTLRFDPLPAGGARAHSSSPPSSSRPEQRPVRILLVEDDPSTLRVMARLLGGFGHQVSTASGVKAALEMSERETFDLLISDIGLQDGSGLDVMRELKRRHQLHGIALSGFGMDEDVRRSREAGFDQHMTKPVSTEWLKKAIQSLTAEA